MKQGSSASPASLRQIRECPGCGLLQTIPSMQPGSAAQCARCPTTIYRSTGQRLDEALALSVAALVLLIVVSSTTLMSVQTSGISIQADLFSGPAELVRRNMSALAAVVLGVTLVAPACKLLGRIYVLAHLNGSSSPPAHLRRVFVISEVLQPWSMIEVFVFGVFVAYVKLGDVVKITLDAGVYALLGLTFVLIWADSTLDRESVWRRLDPAHPSADVASGRLTHAAGCEVCGWVHASAANLLRCSRCHSRLHRRKPDSIGRTWALVIAAAILYVPANLYPVLTVMQLGAGSPSTILGGVEELIASRMYPLAALVFFASIAIPMLKLIGLSVMLVFTQTGRIGWLRDRTRLYHVVRWVGRWSMIDIFMEALLGALVRFGNVITIEPGIGAVAFCSVVILTMFAAETFDPRLMWDAAVPRAVPARATTQAR